MIAITPKFTIPANALCEVLQLALRLKLNELHIIDGCILQELPITEADQRSRPQLMADLKELLGPALQLHLRINKNMGLLKKIARNKKYLSLAVTTKRYELAIENGMLRWPRLELPANMVAPINTTDAMPLCEWFTVSPNQCRALKTARRIAHTGIDILVRAEQAQWLAVPDPDMAGHGDALMSISPVEAGPADYRRADLTLRCTDFFPAQGGDRDVRCRVFNFPQTKQRFWLVTKLPLGKGADTVQIFEPLTLAKKQRRQLPEAELMSRLEKLAA